MTIFPYIRETSYTRPRVVRFRPHFAVIHSCEQVGIPWPTTKNGWSRMSVLKSNKNNANSRLTPHKMLFMLKHFTRREDGAMTIFAVFIFLMMLLVAGIGVDLMRNEMERTKLQNTIDRAVLAAADLDQTLDPQAVVTDYFDKAGVGEHLSQVTVSDGINFRTVTAQANATTTTQFM